MLPNCCHPERRSAGWWSTGSLRSPTHLSPPENTRSKTKKSFTVRTTRLAWPPRWYDKVINNSAVLRIVPNYHPYQWTVDKTEENGCIFYHLEHWKWDGQKKKKTSLAQTIPKSEVTILRRAFCLELALVLARRQFTAKHDPPAAIWRGNLYSSKCLGVSANATFTQRTLVSLWNERFCKGL